MPQTTNMNVAATTTGSAPRFLHAMETEVRTTWRLHVLSCPDIKHAGGIISLPLGRVALGRSPLGIGRLVAMDDRRLSRQHLEFIVKPDRVEVRDTKSRNGTWLAGRRVQVLNASHGAIIRLGDTVCVLEADGGNALSSPLKARTFRVHRRLRGPFELISPWRRGAPCRP